MGEGVLCEMWSQSKQDPRSICFGQSVPLCLFCFFSFAASQSQALIHSVQSLPPLSVSLSLSNGNKGSQQLMLDAGADERGREKNEQRASKD
jgi:hypothetical protein